MPDEGHAATKKAQYGKCFVDMMEGSNLSSTACWCYTVMTSFGKDICYAAMSTIARRMRVKDLRTVRDAQAELLADGWIIFIKGGSNQETKHWQIVSPSDRLAKSLTSKKCTRANTSLEGNASQPYKESLPSNKSLNRTSEKTLTNDRPRLRGRDLRDKDQPEMTGRDSISIKELLDGNESDFAKRMRSEMAQ